MYPSILVEEFAKLPKFRRGADLELWQQHLRQAVREFCDRVRQRYAEGTLQRLLHSPCTETRRAATLALGTLGSWGSNSLLARMLHDPDEQTAALAADALWELWFRAGTPEQNQQLQALLHTPDLTRAMRQLNELIQAAPTFAEARNQRAILHFQRGDFRRSLEDCQAVLELNPHHFGAQCGAGHCLLKLRMTVSAASAYQRALEINPRLTHLEELIRNLQEVIGGNEEAAG